MMSYGKLTGILCTLLLAILLSAAEKPSAVVTVLQSTDIHGSRNILRIRTLIEQERRAAGGEVLLIDCGDLVQGSFESSLDQGAEMFELLNRCRYDVFVPGNHDFEFGPEAFVRNSKRFHGTVLCANLFFHRSLEDNTASCKVFVRNGIRIAVIGCAPEGLERWIHAPFFRLFRVVPVWQGVLRAFRDMHSAGEQPDVIILAVHQGEFSSNKSVFGRDVMQLHEIVRRFPAINLILLGHTHSAIPGKPLRQRVWMVQAPEHGNGIARIRIEVDPDSRRIRNITSKLLSTDDVPPTGTMPEAEKKHQIGERVIAEVPSVKMTAEIYAKAMADVTGVKAGFCTVYSLRPWLLDEEKSKSSTPIRITERDLYEFIPFENRITILSLTADELKKILAEQKKFSKRQAGSKLVLYGMTENELNFSGRVDVAFTSFAASGGGSRYPEVRRQALQKSVPRRDLEMTTREVVRKYLQKVYPPPLDR